MAKTDPPLCPTRTTNYSIKHIIIHCPNFNEGHRRKLGGLGGAKPPKLSRSSDDLYEAIGPFSNFPNIIKN